jgi:hypothetical protein
MPKRKKVSRPNKVEQHIYFTVQRHIDADSSDIMRKRYLLTVEEETIDDEIKQATDKLNAAKMRKQKVAAEIFALATILESR